MRDAARRRPFASETRPPPLILLLPNPPAKHRSTTKGAGSPCHRSPLGFETLDELRGWVLHMLELGGVRDAP